MKKNQKQPADAEQLRRQAEERLRKRRECRESGDESRRSAAETARLLHELEVHQIELEMQKEELEGTRRELQAALEKYTDLYDFAPVSYLTLDRDGTILEANLAGAGLLGIERGTLIKRCLLPFVSKADRPAFTDFLEEVFASGGRESCEVALLPEGGPPLDVKIDALVYESGDACRMTLMDLTRRKQAERDRLILNKLESTGILAGGVAHDFNNLLTMILLNLEMVQESIPPHGEPVHRLKEAKKAVVTAGDLTGQLMIFSEGGAPVLKLTALSRVIHESVSRALSGSRVQCEFSMAEDLWQAEVDAGQLGQVIRNVVLNAKEAMPQAGRISVRAENVVLGNGAQPPLRAGDYVRISIADQGSGIPKDVLPKIFDPYYSTKERGEQKGMGLGLTICHAIIQKHTGAMTVESEAGAGTTCHIHLPASRT